jgi:hypothetical protein
MNKFGYSLSNPFKPSGFGSIFSKLLFCWRPRRDLNPCYRRERTRATRNSNILRARAPY